MFSRRLSNRFTVYGGLLALIMGGKEVYQYAFGVETEDKVLDDIDKVVKKLNDERLRLESIVRQLAMINISKLGEEDKKRAFEIIEVLEKKLEAHGSGQTLGEWRTQCCAKLLKIKAIL